MTDRLNAHEALKFLDSCLQSGLKVLAIEGFEIVENGYIARLDLICDIPELYGSAMSVSYAKEFVELRKADNILFEVWTE
jgi:hypothetical protein